MGMIHQVLKLLSQGLLTLMPEVPRLLTVVTVPISPLSIVSQLYSSLIKLSIEYQLWVSLFQLVRVVIVDIRWQVIIVDLYVYIWFRAHGMHGYWHVPVILVIMVLTLILWCHIQLDVLISVTIVVIPSSRWRVCLGILCPVIMSIVLLVLLAFLHSASNFMMLTLGSSLLCTTIDWNSGHNPLKKASLA